MPEIVLLVDIAAPPAAVLPLIGQAAGFRRWWNADAAVHWRRDQAFPGHTVRWACTRGSEWRRSRLLFELQPTRAGVELWLVHSSAGDATPSWCRRSATLGALLFRIKELAENSCAGTASAFAAARRSRSPRAAREWQPPQSRQGVA